MLQSLQQIERTGQASLTRPRLMSDGFIEVEGGGYYRLTPAGETELARLLRLIAPRKTSATRAQPIFGIARGAGLNAYRGRVDLK